MEKGNEPQRMTKSCPPIAGPSQSQDHTGNMHQPCLPDPSPVRPRIRPSWSPWSRRPPSPRRKSFRPRCIAPCCCRRRWRDPLHLKFFLLENLISEISWKFSRWQDCQDMPSCGKRTNMTSHAIFSVVVVVDFRGPQDNTVDTKRYGVTNVRSIFHSLVFTAPAMCRAVWAD